MELRLAGCVRVGNRDCAGAQHGRERRGSKRAEASDGHRAEHSSLGVLGRIASTPTNMLATVVATRFLSHRKRGDNCRAVGVAGRYEQPVFVPQSLQV